MAVYVFRLALRWAGMTIVFYGTGKYEPSDSGTILKRTPVAKADHDDEGVTFKPDTSGRSLSLGRR